MTENPLPSELPTLLTTTLLSVEGLRRTPNPDQEDWIEAREALRKLDRRQANLVHPSIADEVQRHIDQARAALEAKDAEAARVSLHGVGRTLDTWVKQRSLSPEPNKEKNS